MLATEFAESDGRDFHPYKSKY